MDGKVAIIGTGLIGGSIGLALRASGAEVVGHDDDYVAARAALQRGAIERAASSASEAVDGAELVILAVPVDRMEAVCSQIDPGPEAVVTDVGSAKAAAVAHGEASFGERFIGGHPMAGSERQGVEAADAALFQGAYWILTPTPATSDRSYGVVADLAGRLGATPVAVEPAVHDALVARLSHLPQLVASALVEVAVTTGDQDALLGLAAGGFRDVTRIAASDAGLWVPILRANRSAVLDALDGLERRFEDLGSLLREGRWEELRLFLDRARRARLQLFAKPVYGGDPAALDLMIPDRPGVLAEVTTAAGEIGANIEDLRIIHSTEGGRGRLHLVVAGEEKARRLESALERLGYRVERGELLE
ncbi:MAG: prephenate dehydrogenase/arogenate dehydrogenase family protein [Actinobacteria bacterium]|nr:prephenate dehydrogenase/arogenate dehydrogenase family protein [Actinomycetota bacterium]